MDEVIGLVGVGLASATITGLMVGNFSILILPLAIFTGLVGVVRVAAPRLSMQGACWLAVGIFAMVTGWLWSSLFVDEANLPFGLELAALLSLTALLALSMITMAERVAREAVLTHGRWHLPTRALRLHRRAKQPRVSIHLACYAEPPEIVKETMNRLAALDYDNFEVLVCDNNTKDEALWRPLESHALLLNRQLGRDCFRFFHVAPLAGAKAGALNFCLEQMDPEAELVGVIDADYYAEEDFLSRLVPFFANPGTAYVQTPHDYRDYEGNPYLTGSYWEYMPNNKVDMPGVSEYGGAFTIGTMCLLRTSVLRKVGGWAEWCLTEDSEVSVRLRAAGYHGLYIAETFGRGLIPDNFDDYKKQRFRWTAGPVQQLVRHWRLFMPSPFARPMPGWTKLLEILRCASPIMTLVGLVTGMVVLGGMAIATAAGRMTPLDVPDVAWVMIGLTTVTALVRLWHRYRLTGCTRISDMLRGEVARASLTYIVLIAGVAGLSNKPLAWRRTPKFGEGGTVRAALASAFPETVLGVLGLAAAVALFTLRPTIGDELGLLAAGGMAMLAVRFLCAPYMALLALRKPAPATAESQTLPDLNPLFAPKGEQASRISAVA